MQYTLALGLFHCPRPYYSSVGGNVIEEEEEYLFPRQQYKQDNCVVSSIIN